MKLQDVLPYLFKLLLCKKETWHRLVSEYCSFCVNLTRACVCVCVCAQIPEENLFHCRVLYEDSVYAPLRGRQELEENVGIYLADDYEKITVPVPHFGGSDPADIIHDFHRVRTKTWHTDMTSFNREHIVDHFKERQHSRRKGKWKWNLNIEQEHLQQPF